MIRKVVTHSVAAIVVLACCTGAVYLLRGHVEKRIVFPDQPAKVVLLNRPAWMSDFLAEQIIAAAEPTGAKLDVQSSDAGRCRRPARSNPWIRKVKHVRRAYSKKPGDTIEIDCEYRVPLALVHWKDYYWLVDGDGVKLPEQFTQSS